MQHYCGLQWDGNQIQRFTSSLQALTNSQVSQIWSLYIIISQILGIKSMQVLEFFTKKKTEQIEPVQFTPSVQISPTSTLFVECTPNDPHTGSTIVINCYQSKTNRTSLQVRIQWRRFKVLTDNQHTNYKIPYVTGTAYRCEPADLGYYIQAKIVSYDVAFTGSAEVTVGPIRLDPAIKQQIEGALYSKSLRSQIKIAELSESRDADMLITDRSITIVDRFSSKQLEMPFDMQDPKVQINQKDPIKIFLRFEKDFNNKVRQWLDGLFGKLDRSSDSRSFTSQGSGSKSRFFQNGPNAIEMIFLTRSCRDQFIFSMRALVAKQQIKNTIAIETIENVSQMKTPADAHKFFQFMSLKSEIYRLADLAKHLQIDRDNKLKDLAALQESIAETTTTYVQLLEKKGKQFNLDFTQSYLDISIKRDQIMGRKMLRELQTQNENLKNRIRDLNEEIEFRDFLPRKNNESLMLNQTKNNPFAKKESDSYYGPSMAFQQDDKGQRQNINFAQLSKSHANLLRENAKLKQQKKMFIAGNNHSMTKDPDMIHLLESLHEADQQPASVIKKLKTQNSLLKSKVEQMNEGMKKLNRSQAQMSVKLNQSIAYEQKDKKDRSGYLSPNHEQKHDKSFTENRDNSFVSLSQSNINDSITSEAAFNALQNKLKQIAQKNKEILGDNERLRGERDKFRTECEKLRKGLNVTTSPIDHRSVMSYSNYFDPEGLKAQNEALINEKNSLLRKIQSLSKQVGKGDNLLQKKCQQLTKQNNYLRKQNEALKQKIQSLKSQSRNDSNLSINYQENDKMKKINGQLLEEIKNLKLELDRKNSPLYNSRVIELQNQLNFFKSSNGGSGEGVQKATQDLINQISKLQKQLQVLSRENSDKEAKLASQTRVLQRYMNSDQRNESVLGKDKSYSETRNDSESNDKLKKKIKQLQEQIVLLRRSADAFNRSHDCSQDMLNYNEEMIEIINKQKSMLLTQNQQLTKMIQKYKRDAIEATKQLSKWKQQAFDLMKINQSHSVSRLDL